MSGIYNPARFYQKTNFSGLLMPGTDVDFFSCINGQMYLAVEWKSVGAGLPFEQRKAFQNLVRDLGQVKPVFFVVAYHDTVPEETIDGANSYVGEVFYRLPNMAWRDSYTYEDDTPSLNQWLADFSYEFRLKKVLKAQQGKNLLWEGIPQTPEDWDGKQQFDGPSEFFDYIRPVRHSYEYV